MGMKTGSQTILYLFDESSARIGFILQKTYVPDFLNGRHNSLSNQKQYYRHYIAHHTNWQLVGIFSDSISARTIQKRRQFQRMMSLCRSGKIDLILAKSIKRFGRNTLDLLQTFQELNGLGVEVYFEVERMHIGNPKDLLMLTIFAGLAQNESENLSADIKWGIRHAFRSGTSGFITRPCYGYRKDKCGELVIHEAEAKIVKKIFRWRHEGCSLRKISELLFSQGILSPSGKAKWGSETINKLLHNEKYTGNVILQKTYVPDFLNGKQRRNDGRVDKYYIENTHESIVENTE